MLQGSTGESCLERSILELEGSTHIHLEVLQLWQARRMALLGVPKGPWGCHPEASTDCGHMWSRQWCQKLMVSEARATRWPVSKSPYGWVIILEAWGTTFWESSLALLESPPNFQVLFYSSGPVRFVPLVFSTQGWFNNLSVPYCGWFISILKPALCLAPIGVALWLAPILQAPHNS